MKAVLYRFLIVSYTSIIAVGAFSLLLFSVQVNHLADTDKEPTTIEKQAATPVTNSFKIASGPFYKKIEYNENFEIVDLFPIIKQTNEQIQVTHTYYDNKKIGSTPVTVTFENEAGAKTTRLVLLEVADTTSPVITTIDKTLQIGELFDAKQDVSALDNVDGDLSQQVKVYGSVDPQREGEYSLQYEVSDKSKNTTKINRMVTVVKNEEATIETNLNSQVEASESAQEPLASQPPTTTTSDLSSETATAEPVAPTYQPSSLYIAGVQVPYQNGGQGSGQSIIDSNPSGIASTWGGAPIQSGNDGQNTHFIGHSPGIFSVLFSVGPGSVIVVTDSAGIPTNYTVNNTLQLDDYGTDLNTKIDYWDLTVGTGGGERITLQTCISDTVNLMVLASVS